MRSSSLRMLSLFVVLFGAAMAALAASAPTLFTIADPRGDDHGSGQLLYPSQNDDFQRGELDLVALSARAGDGGTTFTATFARAVRRPIRRAIDEARTQLADVAKLGFYNLNLDLYIDTDRQAGSGGVQTLPGRRAVIDPRFAWERAVCLTPRPYDARDVLKRILLASLKSELREKPGTMDTPTADKLKLQIPADVEEHLFFPTRVRVVGRDIEFFVPDSFLGQPARAEWAYTVVVSGCDFRLQFDLSDAMSVFRASNSGLLILPVGSGRPANYFGGGRENDELQPPLVDIVVPAGMTQEKVLADYDGLMARPVVLPAVVPAESAAAPN